MPVLLHSFVVIAKSPVRHKVDVIGIVEAVVSEIVTSGRCNRRDEIKVVELRDSRQISLLDKHVHHLGNISSMQVIVVSHVTPVSLVDLSQEPDKLIIVDGHLRVHRGQVVHNLKDCHRETLLTSDLRTEIEYIEVVLLQSRQYL